MTNELLIDKPLDEVVAIYHQFYSEEQEQKYGVLAIKVEVIG